VKSDGSVTIILNPHAGAPNTRARNGDLVAAFANDRCAPTIVEATGDRIAAAARRAAHTGSTLVVAAGGDGTVSTVAAAVAETGTTLGVIPLGTLNHFAKDLGIPVDLGAAAATIANGRVAIIDAGDVNGHLFVNNASVGLYPRLVWERMREQERGRPKPSAFLLALARVWRRYRRVAVGVHDGHLERTIHTPFVFVGNNEYTLEGVRIGARMRIDQGRLHVCMAPGLRRLEMIRILLAAVAGRLHTVDRFESLLTQQLSIAAHRRRLGVTLDGELTVLDTPLRFRIRPGALRVIVPADTDASRLRSGQVAL
jgi:diacylglycerol kinase family enzyme